MAMMPNAPPGGPPMDQMAAPQMGMEQPQQAGDTEMLVAELAQHAGRVQEIIGELNARGVDIDTALAGAQEPMMPDPLGGAGLPPENGLGGNTGLPQGLLGELA
tara:strand:+ start:522 stop:833 length:312 start_codon:yes stop_codon:yes gene_type:complete